MNPLGVCTWTFGDQPLAFIAQRLADLGFDGVELLGDLSLYTPQQAAGILADHGLQVFSLTPENVDLAHPEAGTRAHAVDYFLRLLDFAAQLGQPLVSVHGLVGRVAPLTTMAEEMGWLEQSVARIAEEARQRGLRLVFEVLNRYETHTIQTCREALALIQSLGADNLGVLLDAYHMNIEEADPAAAIRQAGDKLWLYHAADSNRQAIGRGHTDFTSQIESLNSIGYRGPIILECTAPGPNPFTPIKDEGSLEWLERYLAESRQWLMRQHVARNA